MHKEAIQTDLPAIGLPFSWGVKFGDLVFVAGQGPLGVDGKVIEGDVRFQTRKTLENFRKVVEAAGSSLDHVLSTTVYLKDLEDFRGMNEVYSESFAAEPRPARATVRAEDRKSTRLNSSHANISYAVFCLKKKKKDNSSAYHTTPDAYKSLRAILSVA